MSGVWKDSPDAEPPSAEERELAGAPDAEPREPPRAVVPRWVQLVLLPLSLIAVWAIAKAAGKVLVIFIVAALIALILNPLVSLVQRARLPRGLAVLAVYLAFFLMLSGLALLLANPISSQVESFSRNVPSLVRKANRSLAEFQTTLNNNGVHVHFIKQGETALQTLQDKVVKGSSSIVSFGGGLLTEVVSAGFDLVLVFILSIYMLLYGQRIGRLIRRYMPDGRRHARRRLPDARAERGRALRGRAAPVQPDHGHDSGRLAVPLRRARDLPRRAQVRGGLRGVLRPDGARPLHRADHRRGPGRCWWRCSAIPSSAVWVSLMFLGLQQVEGHIVAPQVFGHTLRINPLLVIFALLLGLQLHGIVGALIALPLLSILRETVVYLSRHITFESWERPERELL